jgi:hypothetical protein
MNDWGGHECRPYRLSTMSNFLNNLVARTLELAPVVQPRIQSRFEPVQATTPAAPDQTVELEAPPEPQVATTKIVETDPKPIVVAPQQHTDLHQVINTIRNTHVESHEVVQIPIIEKVREQTQTETRIHTEKNTDSRLEIRENQILERAPRPEAPRQNPPNPRLHLPEPAPPVTREAPVTTPQPIVPRVVTRIEPVPVAPAPRFEVPPLIQSEPTETINVTIGRVDVRAVFSSQAPAAPRSRPAVVNSLDDYLKQRSEGRR